MTIANEELVTVHTKPYIPTREEFHRLDSGIIYNCDFNSKMYMSTIAGRIKSDFVKDSICRRNLISNGII